MRASLKAASLRTALIDGAFQHGLDGPSGTVVHAVVELEVADRELGAVDVKVQRIECRLVETVVLGQLGIQPLQGIEVLSLIGVIERLAEVEVPQVGTRRRTDPQSQGQSEAEQLAGRPFHGTTIPPA